MKGIQEKVWVEELFNQCQSRHIRVEYSWIEQRVAFWYILQRINLEATGLKIRYTAI